MQSIAPSPVSHGGLSRFWYGSSLAEFIKADPDIIVAQIVRNGEFDLLLTQRDAWIFQINFLQSQLANLAGSLFLEFSIPRMGRRIDAVLLVSGVIFVIEFKVGAQEFERAAFNQAWDYALDLKNFHEASHSLSIIPILIATEAMTVPLDLQAHEDKVYEPLCVNTHNFREALDLTLQKVTNNSVDERQWSLAPYRPTPTIVEAARTLYAQHSVEAITRHDAGAQNLRVTSARIEDLVDEARQHRRKLICFVTGVPGAGKTLAGLNVATHRRDENQPTHAVFLSGNGPLVAVLTEALTRDEVARQRSLGNRVRKGEVRERVKAFIQNVHHFRDEALRDEGPPPDQVVIFDEAQRAWNLRQTANFMKRRKKLPGFTDSEPEFLISYMDRHAEWAVIVCLVGGGQEIHTGEAGIDAWLDAINSRFPHWAMHISSKLTDSEYAAGQALAAASNKPNTHFDDCLHLAVSMRSFRTEKVSAFVKAALDCEKQQARETLLQLVDRYPIMVTRNLNEAKQWVRSRARGTERFGVVASSKAQRLKPHAIDIRVNVDPVHWFLNDKDDTRSSYYLENAATEFQVQGLELDWTCVTWDGDLRFDGSCWSFHDFRGDRWTNIANTDNRRYLLNAYRVLLTRARQGMAIFVPPGDPSDPTRSPEFYDPTFQYLCELGVPQLR